MVDLGDLPDSAILGTVLVGIGVALYGGIQDWYGPAFTSAIASSGLVLATTLSLITTRDTLREQRLSREQDAKPLLRMVLTPTTLSGYSIMVENVGNGPATEIEIKIEAVGTDGQVVDGGTVQASLPTVAAGESIAVSRGVEGVTDPRDRNITDEDEEDVGPLDSVDQVTENELDSVTKLVMTGKCEDILEKKHPIDSKFYTRYLQEGMAQYSSTDIPSELKQIRQSIDSLELHPR